MRLLSPYWQVRRDLTADLFDEMEKIFGGPQRQSSGTEAEQMYVPFCDINENEEHYLMAVDLPGVKKEDIKIEMNENMLSISGERKLNSAVRTFNRRFNLPNTVDANKIEAQFEDGVLKLYIPKNTVARTRKIEIQNKGGFFDKLLGNKENKDTATESPSH